MALNLQGFVTPEQDFGGMYKVSDTLYNEKLMKERQAEKDKAEEEEKTAKRSASVRYFANYLNPKDKYTGTNYDPNIYKYLGDAFDQAKDLAMKGAGEAEIFTAISPLVNKANDYEQKAKSYSKAKEQLIQTLSKTKGYNPELIGKYLDEEVFGGKEIDKVDPTDIVTPLNNIFQKYGSEITNDDAIDDYIKNLPKSQTTTDVSFKNRLGGYERSKQMIDMPNMFIQEDEGGQTKFVPRYDKATDYGEDILMGGSKVRLLNQEDFNKIIGSNPAIKQRVEALVMSAINSGEFTDEQGKPLSLSSPQAMNLGRALLYEELANKAEIKRTMAETKAEAPVRNITNINMPGATPSSVTNMGNEFDLIDLGSAKKSFWSGKETIPSSAITANAKAALKAYGLDLKDINEFKVERNANGTVEQLIPILKDKDGKIMGDGSPISRTAMRNAQLKFNSERAKDEQLSFGKNDNTPTNNTYLIKGEVYSEKQLLDMGYTLDQIKSYKK